MEFAKALSSLTGTLYPEMPLEMTSIAVPILKHITGVPHMIDWFTIDGPASSIDGLRKILDALYAFIKESREICPRNMVSICNQGRQSSIACPANTRRHFSSPLLLNHR